MNIRLVHGNSSASLNIFKDTTISYLYKMTEKIFKKPPANVVLFYNNKELPNNSYFIYSVILKANGGLNANLGHEETVIIKDKDVGNDNNGFNRGLNNPPILFNRDGVRKSSIFSKRNSIDFTNMEIIKIMGTPLANLNKQKIFLKCQICNVKNAIFYCRNCNLFICFECNVRYPEHRQHLHINLEDGNINTGYNIYREAIIENLQKTEKAFQFSNEWMITDEERETYLEKIFNLLDQIKTGSFVLSSKSTGYKLNQEMLSNFKVELDGIQIPKYKEEIVDIFFQFFNKENEMNNYIKCVDLQIIKSEFTKKLIQLLKNVEDNFNMIIEDFQEKLNICENMNEFGIKQIEEYIRKEEDNQKMEGEEELRQSTKLIRNVSKQKHEKEKEESQISSERTSKNDKKDKEIISSSSINEEKKTKENNNKNKKKMSTLLFRENDDLIDDNNDFKVDKKSNKNSVLDYINKNTNANTISTLKNGLLGNSRSIGNIANSISVDNKTKRKSKLMQFLEKNNIDLTGKRENKGSISYKIFKTERKENDENNIKGEDNENAEKEKLIKRNKNLLKKINFKKQKNKTKTKLKKLEFNLSPKKYPKIPKILTTLSNRNSPKRDKSILEEKIENFKDKEIQNPLGSYNNKSTQDLNYGIKNKLRILKQKTALRLNDHSNSLKIFAGLLNHENNDKNENKKKEKNSSNPKIPFINMENKIGIINNAENVEKTSRLPKIKMHKMQTYTNINGFASNRSFFNSNFNNNNNNDNNKQNFLQQSTNNIINSKQTINNNINNINTNTNNPNVSNKPPPATNQNKQNATNFSALESLVSKRKSKKKKKTNGEFNII